MAEYNVALLDAFHGRIELEHVHKGANQAEAAVTLAKARFNEDQFAGGSTIDSTVVNAVSGTAIATGAALPAQHIPALPTTLHQP